MNPTMVRQLVNAQLVALRAQAERDRTARVARRGRRTRQPDRRHPVPRWNAAILTRLVRRGNPAGDGPSPAQKTAITTAPNRKAAPAPERGGSWRAAPDTRTIASEGGQEHDHSGALAVR
jgi:hypothetical protein